MTWNIARQTALLCVLFVLFVSVAGAETVVVGACRPSLPTYASISQAVKGIVAGSTVLVCPGIYAEQVTINKPLILRGVQSANAANPTITVPPGGLKKNVIGGNGVAVFYQVLAQGTLNEAVNISNISIDARNNGVASLSAVAGIYYRNASGTISRNAIYNQLGSSGGWGVNLESTWALTKVNVSENTIHDFDSGGIRVNGQVTTNISSNEIVTSSSLTGPPIPYAGIVLGSHSTAVGNRIITYPQPLGTSSGSGIEMDADNVVSRNTIDGFTIGIIPLGSANTIKSNRVSLAEAGIVLVGGSNIVQNNFLFNILHGGAAVQSDCSSTSNIVTSNIINGSLLGIISFDAANTIAPNSFSNVTQLFGPTC